MFVSDKEMMKEHIYCINLNPISLDRSGPWLLIYYIISKSHKFLHTKTTIT